jgi:hypothetical protein
MQDAGDAPLEPDAARVPLTPPPPGPTEPEALSDAEPVAESRPSPSVPAAEGVPSEPPPLTPPPESVKQLAEPPKEGSKHARPPGTLELVGEDEFLEAESIPPSGPVSEEVYSPPPGTEQFIKTVQLEETASDDLELEPLPSEPPPVQPVEGVPTASAGEDLAEPGLNETHVVQGHAVEVTRRPSLSSDTEVTLMKGGLPKAAPATFLELLDTALKLG